MFNVERLRVLHAVVSHGSVTAAADALHITASAVSQQLSKLQDEIGRRLVERRGRGVRATPEGLLLARRAELAFALLERAGADLEATRADVSGDLALAGFPSAARGLVPAALAALREWHPGLRVSFTELEPDEALLRLRRGHLDVVLTQDWSNAPIVVPAGVAVAPIVADVADVALPADHPLAGRRRVGLAALAAEVWVTWPRGESCHDWLVRTVRAGGVEPQIVHTASEHATLLALVAAGLGACIMPRLGRGAVPAGVRFVAVSPTLSRRVYAAWRAAVTDRPAVRAVVRALEQAARPARRRNHPPSSTGRSAGLRRGRRRVPPSH
jgi:DNA-binding transcriptional LysR family regulator